MELARSPRVPRLDHARWSETLEQMNAGRRNAGTCAAVVLIVLATGCTRASGNEARGAERDAPRPISERTLARLAPGTLVEVRLEDSISLGHNHPGEAVRATVTADVHAPYGGGVVIPSGSSVRLRITALEPKQIILWVTELTMRGRQYVVHGRVDSPPVAVRRRSAKPDVVVLRGTRMVFPLDRALTVAMR
jgi:hypothetical protein